MQDSKIDIVIPTMWRAPAFLDALAGYANSPAIGKIVLIDNDPSMRPAISAILLDRLTVVSHADNTYVNPAWNEGVSLCRSEIICIANDDILIDDALFEIIATLDWQAHRIGIVGLASLEPDAHHETQIMRVVIDTSIPLGKQIPSFGACIFMPRRNYSPIPPELKVWYGDDFLVHANPNAYVVKTPLVHGTMSTTISSFDSRSDIHRLISDDIEWAADNLLLRVRTAPIA
jgi:hypothetical protein